MLTIALEKRPAKADRQGLAQGLGGYNLATHGRLPRGERWFFARDVAGTMQAGAKCEEAWGWLYIDWLWVAEAHRRQGWGGRLLAACEAYARSQALLGLHLNTWSFQAPLFYRQQGFTCVGEVADMPPGVTRYWFAKRFNEGEAP